MPWRSKVEPRDGCCDPSRTRIWRRSWLRGYRKCNSRESFSLAMEFRRQSRTGSETRCHTVEFRRQKSHRVRDPVPHDGIRTAEVGPGQRPGATRWNSDGRSQTGSETRSHTMEFRRHESDRVRDPVPHDGIRTAEVAPGQRPGLTRWNSDSRSRTGSETRCHTMEFSRQKSDRVRDPVPHNGIQTAESDRVRDPVPHNGIQPAEVGPGQRPGATQWNSAGRVGPGQRPGATQWNSAGRSRTGSETRCHTMEFSRQKSDRVRDPVPHEILSHYFVLPPSTFSLSEAAACAAARRAVKTRKGEQDT